MDKTYIIEELKKFHKFIIDVRDDLTSKQEDAEKAHDKWEEEPLEDGEYAYPEPDVPDNEFAINNCGDILDHVDDLISEIEAAS